jgi:hypothetical protein
MATTKRTAVFLYLDFGVQFMVFVSVLISLLAAVLSNTSWDDYTGIFVFSMLFLGPWQLLSAFLTMLIYRDKQKAFYFFGALLYMSTLGYIKHFPQEFAAVYMLGGSWSFATWYFWMTWRECVKVA